MSMKLVNIGFGNLIHAGRVISMVSPESAPIKRMIQDVRERGLLIDASFGRSTPSGRRRKSGTNSTPIRRTSKWRAR